MVDDVNLMREDRGRGATHESRLRNKPWKRRRRNNVQQSSSVVTVWAANSNKLRANETPTRRMTKPGLVWLYQTVCTLHSKTLKHLTREENKAEKKDRH